MEIILKEDVIGLGYKNDIVNVKAGYGRNYLIPQGKGVIASESAKKVLAEELKQKAVKLAKIKAEAEALAEKLKAVGKSIREDGTLLVGDTVRIKGLTTVGRIESINGKWPLSFSGTCAQRCAWNGLSAPPKKRKRVLRCTI